MTTPSPTPAATKPVPLISLYRQVWQYAEGQRLRWIIASLLLTGSTLLKLAAPFFAAQAINAIQTGGTEGLSRAAIWILGVVGVFVGAWMMHGPGRVMERSVGVKVRQGISSALFDRLTHVPLAWHDRHHSGELQHRVSQASHAAADFAQNQYIYLQNAVNLVGPLLTLAAMSIWTGMHALVGYLVVAAVVIHHDKILTRLADQENQADRRYVATLLDFLGNVGTLAGLRFQDSANRLLGRRLDKVFEPLNRSILITEIKWCAVDLLTISLTWSLVAAFAWQSHHSKGALLLGGIFMVYQYSQQAGSVIGSMAANFQNLARIRTDFASADLIWNAPQKPAQTKAVDADWESIGISELGYDRKGPGSLHGISFTMERGDRIAIVGPSGAGKSTLLRAMAGLYEPTHGHIEVNGVAQLGVRHLSSVATLIPQEAEVFEATVQENIAFDRPYTTEELEAAARVGAFDKVLGGMPQRWETPITERGFNLSGGQRQRLCLTRGVLAAQGSSVLLLDEPTSALDPLTEAQVHTQLDEAFPDACIMASVHRMSLLAHFNKVLLMEQGRFVDFGTVAELTARQPLFRQLLQGNAVQAKATA